MTDIQNDTTEGDSSGRSERNFLIRQCVARTIFAAVVYAAGLLDWWLGIISLVVFGFISLLGVLPTVITVAIEAAVGVMVYARLRRGIDLGNLKKLDGNTVETDLVELGKMNLFLIGKEIYSIALVILLLVLLFQGTS